MKPWTRYRAHLSYPFYLLEFLIADFISYTIAHLVTWRSAASSPPSALLLNNQGMPPFGRVTARNWLQRSMIMA
jgi:hypothetical protein